LSIFDPVDIYCERVDASFWSEPFNALTNASFLLAAFLLARLYTRSGRKDHALLGLIACIAVVGTGSFTFHTLANKIAQMADVIPIVLFVVYYLFLSLHRLVGLSVCRTLAGIATFLVFAAQADSVPPEYSFNGSIAYFPCLAALLAIGGILHHRRHPSSAAVLKAAACFALSLTFRSIDMMLCPQLALGTHFLWHIFNGVVLYLLGRSLFTAPPARVVQPKN
jgi:hypothetical protein